MGPQQSAWAFPEPQWQRPEAGFEADVDMFKAGIAHGGMRRGKCGKIGGF